MKVERGVTFRGPFLGGKAETGDGEGWAGLGGRVGKGTTELGWGLRGLMGGGITGRLPAWLELPRL